MDKKQYEEFCANAENMRCYDGRGTYDVYQCETCSHRLVTTYKDKGVTPFTIKCPKCGKTMTHTNTFRTVSPMVPVQNWVRPTYEQYIKLSPGMQEHVEQGGLVRENELK